jgi:prepilin-type N-terminal cleavage/methylation domain-containing protein
MIHKTTINGSRKGFTLIELLVVVLVLGILLAVAIPSYLSSVKTARANTANNNAKTIATAMQAFGVANSKYPTAANMFVAAGLLSDLGGTIPANPCNGTTNAGVPADWTITGAGTAAATIKPTNPATFCNAADTETYTIAL